MLNVSMASAFGMVRRVTPLDDSTDRARRPIADVEPIVLSGQPQAPLRSPRARRSVPSRIALPTSSCDFDRQLPLILRLRRQRNDQKVERTLLLGGFHVAILHGVLQPSEIRRCRGWKRQARHHDAAIPRRQDQHRHQHRDRKPDPARPIAGAAMSARPRQGRDRLPTAPDMSSQSCGTTNRQTASPISKLARPRRGRNLLNGRGGRSN